MGDAEDGGGGGGGMEGRERQGRRIQDQWAVGNGFDLVAANRCRNWPDAGLCKHKPCVKCGFKSRNMTRGIELK